jgi:catechol 2,3-dioxygenase-like lactoylglutathione lyase family enzyme
VLCPVEAPEAAQTERFLGSPTVRVDGRDVEPDAETRTDHGIKCRIYRSSDLGQSPVPQIERSRPCQKQLSNPSPWLEHTEPGWDQVTGLVPFIHVSDIKASIAFYQHLGFHITARHPTITPDPSWVSMEAGEASLMLQHADDPVSAQAQGVLFYLFSRDLFGLRDRLIAAGIQAGEIVHGAPGPNAEMRLEDPDGYVLIVAQISEQPPDDEQNA